MFTVAGRYHLRETIKHRREASEQSIHHTSMGVWVCVCVYVYVCRIFTRLVLRYTHTQERRCYFFLLTTD